MANQTLEKSEVKETADDGLMHAYLKDDVDGKTGIFTALCGYKSKGNSLKAAAKNEKPKCKTCVYLLGILND